MRLFLKDGEEVDSPIDLRSLAIAKYGVQQGFLNVRVSVLKDGQWRMIDLCGVDFERTLQSYYAHMRKAG